MLVLNGTAEYTLDDGNKIKGCRYAFIMFSIKEDIDESIEEIAVFLSDLGWDEIDIRQKKYTPNASEITDDILKEAFEYALVNDFAVVIYGGPVDETIKL